MYDYPAVASKRSGVELATAEDEEAIRKYLGGLLRLYFKKRKARISLNEVRTVPDPAVDAVLKAFGNIPSRDLKAFSEHHRKSMAAENKIGDLLEAYLAEVLEPRKWIWCCGNLLTGVDFFRPARQSSERLLLQIKNRSNSENSSSKRIRELVRLLGCPVKITEWHRCRAGDGGTCWDTLVDNSDLSLADEERFDAFIREYPLRARYDQNRM